MEAGKQLIYFIQSNWPDGPKNGPVKIGVSVNPKERMRSLQTANPSRLKLLAVYESEDFTEQELHEYMKPHRLSGEWFQWNQAMEDLIEGRFERFRYWRNTRQAFQELRDLSAERFGEDDELTRGFSNLLSKWYPLYSS